MYFCPQCANLLLIQAGNEGNELFCQSCPYICRVEKSLNKRLVFTRKDVDDVFGGEGSWENVDQTDATCPKCEHSRAFFMQIQIRSADEPMSIFFRCCKCANQWREG
ncbi:hypothetical protein BATDEDRAFT_8263 [Batrachochytrium dendrobatidis JAM81]|uniref:DNA-directed RNA polymerase subunit n=1 Tax=Batrachochytrium dendrobatidis (strain JAM81 / FGSC 10211) TaxID=684364 RepID=F4NRP3_BATDJ|nr:DNA-directed RNA polymerase III core subunit RPC11 [Batrachochytrium dendrobatidis JAM81]EGF83763.1 hypothetical protein BATDEDRAFT_8263 [Batrachochytrium dendrobatidis JAM81]|eukprot:XP_006674983.1 hypothetical protein BATDEDRAFT_8263 [Batrachochytrium dendrobatidis JAM81]